MDYTNLYNDLKLKNDIEKCVSYHTFYYRVKIGIEPEIAIIKKNCSSISNRWARLYKNDGSCVKLDVFRRNIKAGIPEELAIKRIKLSEKHIGKRFGFLTVISFVCVNVHGHCRLEVKCDCGNKKIVNLHDMVAGKTIKCGKNCLIKEKANGNTKIN